LKVGHNNYYNYLTDSIVVGHGETADKYPLIVKGLPYMIKKKGVGHNVEVDVFRVSDDVFHQLDLLEGHPTWYRREKILVNMEGGGQVFAWIYFNIREHVGDNELIKSYEQEPIRWNTIPYSDLPEEKEEEMFCPNCLKDVVEDAYSLYYCKSCDSWHHENDVFYF
jgi:gamma-glutamylcyclotransferase (GGCT)/AIG2-like uncharacterized protein YtfP